MRAGTGNTLSIWQATANLPTYEPLRESASTGIVIVGAGIAGLSCAYALAREGHPVVVLDEGEIGSGETARTSAHLAAGLDDRYCELERLHGPEGALLAAQSHSAAIDRIEQIVREENIACDFERVPGYLVPADDKARNEVGRESLAALRAGLKVDRLDLFAFGAWKTDVALRFSDQAQFHPLRYLGGLAQACARRGVRIHTNTRVREVHGGAKASVTTESGLRLRCESIVVATNSP
ncbi:MAG TPA: FAD-dependent oxidoreductase, partial [Rudaea sp.]